MAAADANEWAGEGVTPSRPSDIFPLKGEGYSSRFSCFDGKMELRDWLLPMLMNGQVKVGEGN